jgi:hypothetical protein
MDDEVVRTRAADKQPKLKYMNKLQDVANREAIEITIELDDLQLVRFE